ncbi:MAG: phosphatase PAP2 family protein [Candidatus Tantalella remota]|nr:phosphatase PAP2 family protein [Candidatus Tantalella remota]
MDLLQNIDLVAFHFINGTCSNPVLDKMMLVITSAGDGKIIFIIALLLVFFKNRNIKATGVLLMAGVSFSYYCMSTLKTLVTRPRPFMTIEGVAPLIVANGFSFPSGHATMAFTAAFIFSACFRKWYIFYTLAVLVGISRIYLGVHYPLDVVAGAALGTLIGYMLVRAFTGGGRSLEAGRALER